MSNVKILDLAVSGLSPHSKYKFQFENRGGNWPIRVSPLSGVFFPERVKTYVYFCSNSGECLQSDPNVFFNIPSNSPSTPGLSLEEKSLYSVLDLIITDFDTSEVIYTHPCIVECDECSPRLDMSLNDIHLNQGTNFSAYSISFNNLIPNQSYTYTLSGAGGNWPIKTSPVSGTINTTSHNYNAKGILSLCAYSGACLSTDSSVLNHNTNFDNNRQYNEDPYSIVKVTLSPVDDYLQQPVSNIFIVTCDDCIPTLNINIENTNIVIDDIDVGGIVNVAFNNLVVGQRYNYLFNGKDGNWPLIVSSYSGSIYAATTSVVLPFSVNFCSNTGVCPDTMDGVMHYDNGQVNPVVLNNIHKQSQFNVSVYQEGHDKPIAISDDILVKCNNCIKKSMVRGDSVVSLDENNSEEILFNLENLMVGEKYNYHFEGINNTWPLIIYPSSGFVMADSTDLSIGARVSYCQSSGSCPNGSANVLSYEYNSNSIVNPNTNFKLVIEPENNLLQTFQSNNVHVVCNNCLRPKSYIIAPSEIILDGPQNQATDIVLNLFNLIPGESYDYYFHGVGNNWPAAMYPISGTVVAVDDTLDIKTKMEVCSSTGICPNSNATVLEYNNVNSSTLNKNINFVVEVVPQNILLSPCSSNQCSVYCNNCVSRPSVELSADTILTSAEGDTHTLSVDISNLNPSYDYKFKLISTNANWPVVAYPMSGTITNVENKSFNTQLSFCSSTGVCSSSNNLLSYDLDSVCDRHFSPLNKFVQVRVELIISDTDPAVYSNETVVSCDDCISSLKVSLDTEYLDLSDTNTVTVTGHIHNIVPNKIYSYEIEGLDSNWPVIVYPLSGTIYSSGNSVNIPIKLSFCASTGVCPPDGGLSILPYSVDENCYASFAEAGRHGSFRLKVSESECDSDVVYSNPTRISCHDCLPKPKIWYKDGSSVVESLDKSIATHIPYELTTVFSGLIVGQTYDYNMNYVNSNWPVVVTPQSGTFIAQKETKSVKTNIGFCYPTGTCVSENTDAILTYSSNSLYNNSNQKFITLNFNLDSSNCLLSTVYSEDFNLLCNNCLPQSSYNISISGGPIMTLPISCCSGTRLLITSVSGAVPKVRHRYFFEALSSNVSLQTPSSGYVTFKDTNSYNVFAIADVNLFEYDEGLISFRLVNESDLTETIDYLAIKCGGSDCPT